MEGLIDEVVDEFCETESWTNHDNPQHVVTIERIKSPNIMIYLLIQSDVTSTCQRGELVRKSNIIVLFIGMAR